MVIPAESHPNCIAQAGTAENPPTRRPETEPPGRTRPKPRKTRLNPHRSRRPPPRSSKTPPRPRRNAWPSQKGGNGTAHARNLRTTLWPTRAGPRARSPCGRLTSDPHGPAPAHDWTLRPRATQTPFADAGAQRGPGAHNIEWTGPSRRRGGRKQTHRRASPKAWPRPGPSTNKPAQPQSPPGADPPAHNPRKSKAPGPGHNKTPRHVSAGGQNGSAAQQVKHHQRELGLNEPGTRPPAGQGRRHQPRQCSAPWAPLATEDLDGER